MSTRPPAEPLQTPQLTQPAAVSTRGEKLAGIALVSALLYFILALIIFSFLLDYLIARMYVGKSYPVLSRLIHITHEAPISYYLERAHLCFSRLSLIVIGAHLGLAAFFARASMRRIIISFFTTPSSPTNLAIFRIAVFVAVLLDLDLDAPAIVWFSSLPQQLQVPPFGVAWVLPYIPISRPLATLAITLLVVACISGIVGFFARTSSLLAMCLALYAFGITQLYGKVSHDHHLIWFLAILSASNCGDGLSIDALLASRTRADRGFTEPPPPSVAYALPLRFAGLLLGIIYFFPGFWKFWTSGFDWALSDNLKYQMYMKWMEFDGWTPFFRLDWHPWLYKAAALETMIFEMSFVFLIFFPRLRRLAVLGGIVFHVASLLFLRIFFYDLLICYVVFFDVSGWLKKLGTRLFRSQLTVFFDGNCRLCRRTIAVIRVMDVLETITFVNAVEDAELSCRGFGRLERPSLIQDIQAISDGRKHVGFEAYRAMALRLPILWPLVPFLFPPPVERIANKVYRHVADSRICNLPDGEESSLAFADERGSSLGSTSVLAVGILLLTANVYTGARGNANGWPFACYPTFAAILGDETASLDIVALTSQGEIIPTDTKELAQRFMPQRFRGLVESLLRVQKPGGSTERLRSLWQLYVQEDSRLEKASVIRFHRLSLCTIPEKRYQNPVRSTLILEMRL
jgi:predicted DCC family thiol-disulfide oxidoreductase YuxK